MVAGEEREARSASRSRISTRLSNSANSVRVGESAFSSQDYSASHSFDAEETVREILFRRRNTGEQEEGLSSFRRDRSQKAMFNSRRLGIIMLILGLINGGLFALLQVRRKAYAECTVDVPDRLQRGDDKWVHTITTQNCSGDIKRFQKANKIYVYYSIYNYPFHGAAAFKLHSKKQLEGKESTKKDVHPCYPYHMVSIGGKEKIIYPCGPHMWHLYSDNFKFSTENPKDSTIYLRLDDSFETLSYCQEYAHMQNPEAKVVNQTL
ncbi:transmembrane domain-containing protein [Babesia ovata]|uniref:Transmembrane domain-containing protein n=1 Tax=Babesia ovata TaxID=189622 RepID=A0A2H6KB55_9APIC|nr:transmembrane domain-containing protein [Babesia ovata]GBE60216.1 transmembrane domain-containing protein [Babesia ovata]